MFRKLPNLNSNFSENLHNSISVVRDEVLPIVDMALPGIDTEGRKVYKNNVLTQKITKPGTNVAAQEQGVIRLQDFKLFQNIESVTGKIVIKTWIGYG